MGHHDLSSLPVFDQHCHNWRRMDAPFAIDDYRMMFTEAADRRAAADVPASIYYRWTIRELAARFDCDANEDSVLEARAALGHDRVAEILMAEANVSEALIDFAYAGRGADLYDVEAMGIRMGGAIAGGCCGLNQFSKNWSSSTIPPKRWKKNSAADSMPQHSESSGSLR